MFSDAHLGANMSDCPLCGGNAVLRTDALPGYIAGTVFRIYGCTHCGVAFAEPRVPTATPQSLKS